MLWPAWTCAARGGPVGAALSLPGPVWPEEALVEAGLRAGTRTALGGLVGAGTQVCWDLHSRRRPQLGWGSALGLMWLEEALVVGGVGLRPQGPMELEGALGGGGPGIHAAGGTLGYGGSGPGPQQACWGPSRLGRHWPCSPLIP